MAGNAAALKGTLHIQACTTGCLPTHSPTHPQASTTRRKRRHGAAARRAGSAPHARRAFHSDRFFSRQAPRPLVSHRSGASPCAAPGAGARHAYRAQRPQPQTTQCSLRLLGRQGMKQPCGADARAAAALRPIGRRRRRGSAHAFYVTPRSPQLFSLLLHRLPSSSLYTTPTPLRKTRLCL